MLQVWILQGCIVGAMPKNPYSYGGPVTGRHFAGRDAEVAALVSRMRNGVSVAVTGPRRYGKSSLILRVVEAIRAESGAVASINLLHCPSLDAFASRLTSAAFEIPGARWRRTRQAVPEFLSRLSSRPTVTFGDDGRPAFGFGGLDARDAGRVLDDVYGMLAALADKRPAVLVFDEFHAIADLGTGLAGVLKALGDEHPQVSLVVASSKRHLMEALVVSKGAPLYNMAERLALGPIEPDALLAYLRARARSGGKDMGEDAALEVCTRAGPVPYDVQRLAYEAFDVAGCRLSFEDIGAGMARVVEHETPDFSDRFSARAPGQRRVLVAVAARCGIREPNAAAFAREVGYATPAGTRRAITSLVEAEMLVVRDGVWVVADPFFAEWLRQL